MEILPRTNGGNLALSLVLIALSLASCTQAQLDKVQSYQDKVAGACAVAMAAAVYLPAVSPWIIGGCASEAAIAKLALDPTSLAWLKGLIKPAA